MKKVILIVLMVVLFSFMINQNVNDHSVANGFQALGEASDHVIPVKKNDRWGLITFNGTQVSSFDFDQVRTFKNKNIFVVKKDDKFGVYNEQGELLPVQYDLISEDDENYFPKSPMLYLLKNNHVDFYNLKTGELHQTSFDSIINFHNNVMISQVNSKYGLINQQGQQIIENKYTAVGFFNNGVVPVKIQQKYGYIDKNGDWTLEPQYERATTFFNNRAFVKKDGQWGMIDLEGNWIYNNSLDAGVDLYPYTLEKYTSDLIPIENDKKNGLIDFQGTEIIDVKYDDIIPFKYDFSIIKVGDEYTVVDHKLKEYVTIDEIRPHIY